MKLSLLSLPAALGIALVINACARTIVEPPPTPTPTPHGERGLFNQWKAITQPAHDR